PCGIENPLDEFERGLLVGLVRLRPTCPPLGLLDRFERSVHETPDEYLGRPRSSIRPPSTQHALVKKVLVVRLRRVESVDLPLERMVHALPKLQPVAPFLRHLRQ